LQHKQLSPIRSPDAFCEKSGLERIPMKWNWYGVYQFFGIIPAKAGIQYFAASPWFTGSPAGARAGQGADPVAGDHMGV
jgi:hypothetical protein